jgi:hypothetical protein
MLQINQDGLKLNGVYQYFTYTDAVNMLGEEYKLERKTQLQ